VGGGRSSAAFTKGSAFFSTLFEIIGLHHSLGDTSQLHACFLDFFLSFVQLLEGVQEPRVLIGGKFTCARGSTGKGYVKGLMGTHRHTGRELGEMGTNLMLVNM